MSSSPESQLRDAALRVTAGRLAVLAAIEEHPHSDADTLCRIVRAQLPGISVQSVHNVLHDLTNAELLRRIEPAGSSARYERRLGDNHHHVVCSVCGTIADVDCVHGEAPCLTPSNTSGFVIDTAEITFWGVCADCTANAGASAISPSLAASTNPTHSAVATANASTSIHHVH
ncbi:Fur family ferric uptake transcriptional regulator [Glaciihabitans tibetensis]|uniref:Fur family ferric uptake transcriptional regulator n=1 Tax=Glaciihabitans tibetensis TaxID=1266600 RepID=A0A2T0VFV5_9MICO|nr:Fur family transcriptional regulator [Glaciihabitans tibetensis]PRY68934.1 Fur family ferric uptake transcriptional regulator [Glaciihabitans tibetensis]